MRPVDNYIIVAQILYKEVITLGDKGLNEKVPTKLV